MEAGHILLENGAEIFRVEETIDRICGHFGVESENAFVLSNGIFLTAGSSREKVFARVKHIPVRGAQLYRVAAVNQLSREIVEGRYDLPRIRERLEQIRTAPGKRPWVRVLMSGIGSGSFCLMFGGTVRDCLAAFAIGCLLYVYLLCVSGRCSKIVENIGGGMVITVLGIFLVRLPLGLDLSHIISGAIMPLVPGLAFTNGIRDIADGDYISGTVRMIDALLVFLSLAAGVGFTISIYHHLTGGIVL
ncbi:MAG: threonine/serine exporter family protein [Eubacteriales bacterium]|nr:threonine/serine exporter family protein [Eubacteriales bacterium]